MYSSRACLCGGWTFLEIGGDTKNGGDELRMGGMKVVTHYALVEEKDSTKYLGVFIDNKLTWKTQIQHIKTKQN